MRLAYGAGVRDALDARRPIVALESTVIAHGLPRPTNLEVARAMEAEVRRAGAVPATIAIADGLAIIGANDALLERLANADGVTKVSTRDLAPVLAAGGLGATTVASTVEIAARAGIAVVATGGIGGVHRGAGRTFDESADLIAIARHPVIVVCAGAKLILDLALTLERLETLGIPVVGWHTNDFPAFYVRSSGLKIAHRVEDAAGAARIARIQAARGAGMVLAVPPDEDAMAPEAVEPDLERVLAEAEAQGIRGAAVTPHLLRALGEATDGRTLRANVALLVNNARVAAQVASAVARADSQTSV